MQHSLTRDGLYGGLGVKLLPFDWEEWASADIFQIPVLTQPNQKTATCQLLDLRIGNHLKIWLTADWLKTQCFAQYLCFQPCLSSFITVKITFNITLILQQTNRQLDESPKCVCACFTVSIDVCICICVPTYMIVINVTGGLFGRHTSACVHMHTGAQGKERWEGVRQREKQLIDN